MKSFVETIKPAKATAKNDSFPTFSQVREGKSSTCMSETMVEKLNEMYEAMCEEMKSCHADETSNTAESYMKECNEKLNEMMENMSKACNECMNGKY